MAKDTETADLFEADGVTPKVKKTEPVITEAQLEAERRAARAEGEASGLKTAIAAKPEKTETPAKVFTRAELRAKVNAGEITEDQMDEMLEIQNDAKILRLVDQKVAATIGAVETKTAVATKIDAYVQEFADINVAGSKLRGEIEAEFQDMVKNGSPNSLATELAAIKVICGPLKSPAGRRPRPDGHQDVGTGSGNADRGGEGAESWAKGITPAAKKHYQKLIDRGIYKGYSDPKLVKELALARKAH